MLINEQKTKEMIITSSQPHALSTPQLLNIERVYNRANSRLHFLRQLKKAAVPCEGTLLFYIAVIRPVTEYVARVWHTGLTAELAERVSSRSRNVHSE